MRLTVEQLDKEVAGLDATKLSLELALARIAGAKQFATDLRTYLLTPDPIPEPTISPENAAIQERDSGGCKTNVDHYAGDEFIEEELA